MLLGSRPVVGPFEQDDLRPAIPTERKKRPAEAPIDVKPMASYLMGPFDAPVTSGGEPERRHAWKAPLSSMAMPAQDEIDMMVLFQLLKDVGSMG